MKIKRLDGIIFLIFAFIFLFITTISAIAGDLNVIGHRGAAGLLPENTLAGFKKAMELGVDTIELDIRLTSDNEAVSNWISVLRLIMKRLFTTIPD